MVDIEYANINSKLSVEIEGSLINSIVVEKPFFDPKKQITTSN
jgi:glycine cleavage system aminomethyltransferase T